MPARQKIQEMSLTAKMSDRGDEDGDAADAPDSWWRPFVVPLLQTVSIRQQL